MNQAILSNVFYLCGNLFRIYLIYHFLKIFFNSELKKKSYVLLRLALYILFFIINSAGFLYFHWNPVIIIASNIIGIFIITLSYAGKWKYRIISTFVIVVICVMCEDLVYHLMLHWNVIHIAAITVAVSDLLLLTIMLSLRHLADLRSGEDISFKDWLNIICVPIISIILSVVTLDKCNNEVAITIGEIGLLLLNIIVFYLFDHIMKDQRIQTQITAIRNQNNIYLKQLNILTQSEKKLSSFRHDLHNHISMLKYLSKADDSTVVQKYLNELENLIKPEEQFVETGDLFIDGIINLKLGEAITKLNAKVNYDVQIFNPGVMAGTDVSILLGNLFDNAIHAMKKCTSPGQLDFNMQEKRGLLFITIKNNHNEIIKEKAGNFISTKKDHEVHGIGLKNVKQIVEKYHGTIEVKYDDSMFCVEILLFLDV